MEQRPETRGVCAINLCRAILMLFWTCWQLRVDAESARFKCGVRANHARMSRTFVSRAESFYEAISDKLTVEYEFCISFLLRLKIRKRREGSNVISCRWKELTQTERANSATLLRNGQKHASWPRGCSTLFHTPLWSLHESFNKRASSNLAIVDTTRKERKWAQPTIDTFHPASSDSLALTRGHARFSNDHALVLWPLFTGAPHTFLRCKIFRSVGYFP